MKTLSIREMREALPRLEKLVLRSGELVVTRRGKPVARVLPMREAKPKPSHADLRSRMQRLTAGSEALIARERDER